MTSPLKPAHGFTLIELLTVIAIIGILASFLAIGLPRAIESAKIAKLENNFLQIRNILTEYYVDHGTYPPAYGYLDRDAVVFLRRVGGERAVDIADLSFAALNQFQTGNPFGLASPLRPVYTRPWMDFMGHHNNEDLYDNFSIAHDTDRDGDISRLEYAPFGTIDNNQNFDFPYPLYDPNNVAGKLRNDLQRQLDSSGPRPLMYFPVNKRQIRKVSSVWYDFARSNNDPDNPRPNDAKSVNRRLGEMRFPPPTYDAYVLISVGPSANTWGMIYEFASPLMDQARYAPAYYYHILGMATYFMATRDAENRGEGDGELDFEFRARTRRGQTDSAANYLPDPAGGNAYGPMIFVGEG